MKRKVKSEFLYADLVENYCSPSENIPVSNGLQIAKSKSFQYYLRNWLPVKKDAKILDLGCGSGYFLSFLLSRDYNDITGVEISPSQIGKSVNPDIKIIESDIITFLNNSTEKYTVISLLDVLEHFDRDKALQVISLAYENLDIGGRIIIQTPNADSPAFGGVRYGDFTHRIAFNAASLTQLLALKGFYNVEAREAGPVPTGYSWKSTVRYGAWILIKSTFHLWNVIETGQRTSNVLTRVMFLSAVKGP